jgi:hypothetical protein
VNFQNTARSEADAFQDWTSQQNDARTFNGVRCVVAATPRRNPLGAFGVPLLTRLDPTADIGCRIHQRDV